MITPRMQRLYPTGRKFCAMCGRWRHICFFHAKGVLPNGEPEWLGSNCEACSRRHNRVRLGIKRRGRPYAARHSKRPQTPEERKKRKAECASRRYKEIKNDPELIKKQREQQRELASFKRREQGIKPRNFSKPRTEGRDPELPVTDEFIKWLEETGLSRVAELLGSHRTYFTRFTKGYYIAAGGKRYEVNSISLGLADRILHAVNDGHQLHDFWPDA